MFDGLALPTPRIARPARLELDPLDRINRNLRAFWPLDEPQRVVARDISPFAAHLTSVTWPTRITSTKGWATNFAGASGQYLQNTSFAWPGGQHAAISVWINVPGSYNGSPWDFGNGRSLVSGNAFYAHLPYGDNNAYFYYGAASSGEISTSLASYLNQWVHIAWATSPNRKAIWINGRLATESGTVSAAVAAGTNAYVGYSPVSSMFHQGAMRLFRLRALAWTDAEVQRLYREPYAGVVDPANRLFIAFKAASGTTYNDTLSDAATLGESHAIAATFRPTLSDAETAGESYTVTATFVPTLSDSETAGESYAITLTANAALSDANTAGESNAAAVTFATTVSDASTIGESMIGGLLMALIMSDSLSAAESHAATVAFSAAMSGAMSAAEAFTAGVAFTIAMAAEAVLADTMIGGLSFSFTMGDGLDLADAFADALSSRGGFVVMSVTATIGRIVLVGEGPAAQIVDVTEQQSRT